MSDDQDRPFRAVVDGGAALARRVNYGGQCRYVGLWWVPAADEIMVSDGHATRDGDPFAFIEWDRTAGRDLLEATADATDAFDHEDIPDVVESLTAMLREMGHHIGTSDEMGDSAFLLDRTSDLIHVGNREDVLAFLRAHNNAADADYLADLDADELEDESGDSRWRVE